MVFKKKMSTKCTLEVSKDVGHRVQKRVFSVGNFPRRWAVDSLFDHSVNRNYPSACCAKPPQVEYRG